MLDNPQVCPELKCLGGLAENQHTSELEKPRPPRTGESKVRKGCDPEGQVLSRFCNCEQIPASFLRLHVLGKHSISADIPALPSASPSPPWKPQHSDGMGAGGRAALETQGPNRQERNAGPTQVDPHVTLGRKGLAIRAATEPCLGSQTLPHLLNPHICSATQTSPTRWWWLRQFPPKLHLGKRKEVRGAGPWQKLPPPSPPCFYTHHLTLD